MRLGGRASEVMGDTKFGTFYAGHVDLDNMGLKGTPVADPWLPNERLATVFDKTEEIARLMDRVGYDTLWMAEHHFQREGYECIPNILMLAVHLVQLTKNLRFGCAFNVVPNWHPAQTSRGLCHG